MATLVIDPITGKLVLKKSIPGKEKQKESQEKNKQDLVTEDGTNCVCSYVKDYTQLGKTQVIAKIKYDSKDNGEVYADES